MEPKEEINSSNMCRTCMVESENMRSLFNNLCGERTLSEVLTFVTNLNIKEQDNLPKQICNECENVLAQSDAFKRRCIDVEARLFNLLKCPKQSQSGGPETIEKPVVKSEVTFETSSQPYQCSICSMKFQESNDLKTHVVQTHPNSSLDQTCIADVKNHFDAKTNVKEELDHHEFAEDVFSSHYEDYILDDAPLSRHHQHLSEIKQKNKDYVCSFCGLGFENKSEHKEHLQVVHSSPNKTLSLLKKEPKTRKRKTTTVKNADMIKDIKPALSEYYCKSCRVHFKNLKSLKNHNWKKHNNPLQKAKTSEFEDKIKKSEDGSKEKYECSLCMRKFVKKMTLIAHLKRHDNPTSYNCTLCKREFVHKAHLDNHILKIHTTHRDGYKCYSCTQHFPTQDSLDLHIEIHHSIKKMHECSYCSKSFNMLSTLKDHLRVHTGEKPFLCPLCGKGFSQNTNLTEHLRRHQGIKPFKCSICDRRFVSKGELAAHNRKHSGAHPFICVDCGNGFTTSSSLVKHRRTHTGEKPYACDLCHLKFAASGTLKNHRRTHTGEKPYKCGLCDKAFVQKNDLTAHTRCHTGERPYVCATCGQAFRQGSALKTHLKMHSIKGTEPLLHPVRKDLLQGLVLPSVGHPDSV